MEFKILDKKLVESGFEKVELTGNTFDYHREIKENQYTKYQSIELFVPRNKDFEKLNNKYVEEIWFNADGLRVFDTIRPIEEVLKWTKIL